jgi:hypothetical protein
MEGANDLSKDGSIERFRCDIPVLWYRIAKYIGKINSNTTCLIFNH